MFNAKLLRTQEMDRISLLEPHSNSRTATSYKIIIIDDNEDHVELISQAFQKVLPGVKLIHFDRGKQALKYIRGHASKTPFQDRPEIQLILLDWDLPDIDGVEVLRRLKRDKNLRSIPVVFLSNVDAPEEIERAMACGAEQYIIKPFAFKDLARTLQKVANQWFVN
ncbi:MAG: response regulator [Calditrichaeota bacterium]|nr:MAG: response regulator [Calditrichota bacterium]